jgi:hypothetical protein
VRRLSGSGYQITVNNSVYPELCATGVTATSEGRQQLADDSITIVSSYFDAWRARDPDALRPLLADDVTFSGPLGQSANAEEYRDAIGRMFAITTDVVIQKMLADDEDVLTWFELHTSLAPPVDVVNWSRVENGKIARVRATFDPRGIIAARERS